MWGCLCRAVTVLSTHYRGQQAAMTSQDCPWGPATTSYCPSWVRRMQSCLNATSLEKKDDVQTQILTFHLKSTLCHRAGLQQPEPGAHGAPHRYWAAGGDQADQPGRVHRGRAAAALGGLLGWRDVWFFLNCFCFTSPTSDLCLKKPRTKFSSPDCSATRTCWLLAWFSAPVASSGSLPHSWPMVSHFYTFM